MYTYLQTIFIITTCKSVQVLSLAETSFDLGFNVQCIVLPSCNTCLYNCQVYFVTYFLCNMHITHLIYIFHRLSDYYKMDAMSRPLWSTLNIYTVFVHDLMIINYTENMAQYNMCIMYINQLHSIHK